MPAGPPSPDRPAALVELRVLDGPNLYFPRPAIKVLLDVSRLADAPDGAMTSWLADVHARPPRAGVGHPRTDRRTLAIEQALADLVRRLARASGTSRLAVRCRPGPSPDQVVVAFPWRRREKAVALGTALARLVDAGVGAGALASADAEGAVRAVSDGARPTVPRPRVPVVAVTGTNGKTTVTRLLAHMGACDGRRVAWSTTDGVYVDGFCVEEGDWSGFGGAGRVLATPGLGLAVLETARGGILLRGIGATHNDVAVVTNVAADHLGLQGITTLDELAEVKASIVRVTRPTGWVVLNADDPRVLAMRALTPAKAFVFSMDPAAPGVRAALDDGGRAASVVDGAISVLEPDGQVDELLAVVQAPVTVGGLASHNVANALAAAAAGLSIGLSREAVVQGLRTFRPDPDLNPGRLNAYDLDGCLVLLDLAHNEEGLVALLRVAHGLQRAGERVITVLGTAGDRQDDVIRALGELAGRSSDVVVIAEKDRYLRGRDRNALTALMQEGLAQVGSHATEIHPEELPGLQAAVRLAAGKDVVAFMCHADRLECHEWLMAQGATVVRPDDLAARAFDAGQSERTGRAPATG